MKLIAVHLAGDAVILYLAYLWLSVGESTGLRLAWSALFGLIILALACWLHAGTLAHYRAGQPFATTLRRVPALLGLALGIIALYAGLWIAEAATRQPAFRLASWLTLTVRVPVKPQSVIRLFQAIFWVIRYAALPPILRTVAAAIATRSKPAWRVPRLYFI